MSKEGRHVLVQVEEDRHAEQPERQRSEDQEVGQRGDLDQRVAPPGVLSRQAPGDEGGEDDVLEQMTDEAVRSTVHRQPDDAQRAVALACGLPVVAEAEDVDLVPGGEEGIGLALDARIPGHDGVHEDGDARGRLAVHDGPW